DKDAARAVLVKRIEDGVKDNETLVKDALQKYFDNPEEQEAWFIGKRAAIVARENGVPGPDQPPAVVKDLDPHPERQTTRASVDAQVSDGSKASDVSDEPTRIFSRPVSDQR